MSDAAALDVFDRRESEVRGYIRAFPTVFDRASGSTLVDVDGREYLDFFAGAGVLNYGHNNPAFTRALVGYLEHGGIIHGLDMATSAKKAFIEAFEQYVLTPRGLDHKLQFTGPTGANAVEAALKVARQATGRSNVVAFTNAFHGLSIGALAATGNSTYRDAAGIALGDITRLPYDGYLGADVDTLDLLEKMLDDPGSGLDLPAAVIVEAVQGEGGINVASVSWLQRLRELTAARGILLILDEIQAGVGRTGTFFAFEAAGIVPDIVTVSKSISGSGLPMSLVLLRPEVDVWKPGAHTGTFRGNNLAFVSARVALETYWADSAFTDGVAAKSALLRAELDRIAADHPELGPRAARPRPHVRARLRQRPHARGAHLGRGVPPRAHHRDIRRLRRGAQVPAGTHDHRRRTHPRPRDRAREPRRGARPLTARASARKLDRVRDDLGDAFVVEVVDVARRDDRDVASGIGVPGEAVDHDAVLAHDGAEALELGRHAGEVLRGALAGLLHGLAPDQRVRADECPDDVVGEVGQRDLEAVARERAGDLLGREVGHDVHSPALSRGIPRACG